MKSSPKRVLLPSFAEMLEENGLEPVEFPPEADEGAAGFAEDADSLAAEAPDGPGKPEKSFEERELERVEELCAGMRREAINKANATVAQAQQEAAAIRGKALRDMEQEVGKRTEEAILPLRRTVEAAAEALRQAREELCKALEPYFLDTAILIARNILHRELDKGDGAYLAIVREVLNQNYIVRDLVLHLPEKQYKRLMESGEGEFAADMERQGVKVVCDKSIGETDCMVTSSMGNTRAGVEVQLARIRYAVDSQQSEA